MKNLPTKDMSAASGCVGGGGSSQKYRLQERGSGAAARIPEVFKRG